MWCAIKSIHDTYNSIACAAIQATRCWIFRSLYGSLQCVQNCNCGLSPFRVKWIPFLSFSGPKYAGWNQLVGAPVGEKTWCVLLNLGRCLEESLLSLLITSCQMCHFSTELNNKFFLWAWLYTFFYISPKNCITFTLPHTITTVLL